MNKFFKSLVQSSGVKTIPSRSDTSKGVSSSVGSSNTKAGPSPAFTFGRKKKPIGG